MCIITSENPLISIIIPIYNVEKYLSECVDSVLKQTYTNLEIILVDDESPDSCPQMCDEYVLKDNRVKVIHKQNGGLSDARNAGLDCAAGDYISLIDGDDWIDPDMISLLYNNIISNDADIACCGFYKSYAGLEAPISWYFDESRTMTNIQAAENALTKMELPSAWAKLYKKHIFTKIRYPVGKLFEDQWIIIDIFMTAGKISFNPMPKYHYRQRRSGIIYAKNKETKMLAKIDMFEGRFKVIKEKYPVLAQVNDIHLYRRYIRIIRTVYADKDYYNSKTGGELLSSMFNKIQSYADNLKENSCLTKDEKILLYIIKCGMFKVATVYIKYQNKHNKRKKKPKEITAISQDKVLFD